MKLTYEFNLDDGKKVRLVSELSVSFAGVIGFTDYALVYEKNMKDFKLVCSNLPSPDKSIKSIDDYLANGRSEFCKVIKHSQVLKIHSDLLAMYKKAEEESIELILEDKKMRMVNKYSNLGCARM